MIWWANKGAAANRRPAGQLDGSGDLSAIVATYRATPAAVAELRRYHAGTLLELKKTFKKCKEAWEMKSRWNL